MPKILVVDDERGYSEKLAAMLGWEGHETRTATSGREAIDVGARFRPDVLVADWMLKNHIHGLHVAEVLRLVDARLRTILMTGYASPDLRAEAQKMQVVDFIEKPFDMERIQDAVRHAVLVVPTPRFTSPVGIVEVDAAGRIAYANPRAIELFDLTDAGKEAAEFSDLFQTGETPDLDRAAERWVTALPASASPVHWHLRSQSPRVNGSRLVVILLPEDPHNLGIHLIEMLLEFKDTARPGCWPFEERLLVIDDDPMYRRFIISMLDAAGAGCYGAADEEYALRLLKGDDEIGFVIIEHEMPGIGVEAMVRSLRGVRPEITIIGHSEADRRDAFAAIGVDLFLLKPWRVRDLVDLVAGETTDGPQG